MATVTGFIQEFRTLMSDPDTSGKNFDDAQIKVFMDKGLRYCYKKHLAREVPNYLTTYTEMPLAVTTSLDYTMPTNWIRVLSIEYWTNTTNTMYLTDSSLWDDRARPGYVRIFDAPDYSNQRIHMIGLKKWTGIDDSNMPDAVYDCVMSAAMIFAVGTFVNQRAAGRRSLTSVDASLGAEVLWVDRLKMDLKQNVREARVALRGFR